jgi:hypothetical protein
LAPALTETRREGKDIMEHEHTNGPATDADPFWEQVEEAERAARAAVEANPLRALGAAVLVGYLAPRVLSR